MKLSHLTAVLATLALTACGTTPTVESKTPTPSPTYYTSTPEPTPTSTTPTEVTYKATSNHPAEAYWNGNGESHSQKFTDTFEVTIPLNGEYDFTTFGVSLGAGVFDTNVIENTVLTCQTIVNGEVIEEKTGTGVSAQATCQYPTDF